MTYIADADRSRERFETVPYSSEICIWFITISKKGGHCAKIKDEPWSGKTI